MRHLTLGTALIAGIALPLQAQNVTSTDPQALTGTLASLGQTATLTTDFVGDPLIEAEGDAGPYQIWFYGCTANASCTAVNFSAGFDLPNGSTLEAMNGWNSERIVGRAFLDSESDPYVDQFLVLGGGVTLLNFGVFVREWNTALGEFRELINF